MSCRFLPGSLFGRLLLGLLVTIGVAVFIIGGLLLRWREGRLADTEVATLVSQILATMDSLANLNIQQRIEWIELHGGASGFDLGARRQSNDVEVSEAARSMQTRLEEVFGSGYTVTVTPNGQGGGIEVLGPELSKARREIDAPGSSRAKPEDSRDITTIESDLASADALDPTLASGREAALDKVFGWTDESGTRHYSTLRSVGPTGSVPSASRAAPSGPMPTPPGLEVIVDPVGGPPVRFIAPVPAAPSSLPVALSLQLPLQLLAVTLVLGVVLYPVVRSLTHPLRELERAAEAVSRGARVAPLSESGVREVQSATRAFNAMQERLYRYLDGRSRGLLALSHDLRTPLTRLKLRVEMLEDEALRERLNADLDAMERMVTNALRIFKDADQDEAFEPVRVEELIADLRRECAELGHSVTASGHTRGLVYARRDPLKRCLENLISNAIKYGERANVTVADDAGDVVVRVQDEGPGIPESMLEKVFEPFFRLEGSRNVDTGGIGLGLSIARDVAQAHNGSLVLRNLSPRGLEAILRLPGSSKK
jgi:signal transduction histidine kinase